MNKTQELARFLLGKSESLDFIDPAPSLVRSDSQELRERILNLTASEARKLGLAKTTLLYLKRRAQNRMPFKIYSKVLKKLETTLCDY